MTVNEFIDEIENLAMRAIEKPTEDTSEAFVVLVGIQGLSNVIGFLKSRFPEYVRPEDDLTCSEDNAAH